MRGLTASDILWVWEWGQHRHPIDRALLLLNAADSSRSHEDLSALTIGQRDARLLSLRAATFGDAIQGLAECPHCGAALEFSARASDLFVAAQPHRVNEPVTIEEDGTLFTVRAPDSRDIAMIAAAPDVATASQELQRRCVVRVSRNGVELASGDIPTEISERIAKAIAGCDPQADIAFDLHCDGCARDGQVAFDIAAFFWTELAGKARRLLREVHALASAYGWSEAEILALTPARRRMYLEVAA